MMRQTEWPRAQKSKRLGGNGRGAVLALVVAVPVLLWYVRRQDLRE